GDDGPLDLVAAAEDRPGLAVQVAGRGDLRGLAVNHFRSIRVIERPSRFELQSQITTGVHRQRVDRAPQVRSDELHNGRLWPGTFAFAELLENAQLRYLERLRLQFQPADLSHEQRIIEQARTPTRGRSRGFTA